VGVAKKQSFVSRRRFLDYSLLELHGGIYLQNCKEASKLIQDIVAESLLADGAYDSTEIIQLTEKRGLQVVISPRKNRKSKRTYDKHLYELRHLVETAIPHLKRRRSIATRYAKNSVSFLAGVQIRYIAVWASIL